jgi:cell division transport system permease protein
MSRAPSPALLLPGLEGGPAPWVVAVMSALALLALALAAALAPAATALGQQIAGRATVQIVEGDPISRREAVAATRRLLADAPYVAAVRTVPEAELVAMAERWLGDGVRETGLPLPALIDVDLIGGGNATTLAQLRRDVAGITGARVVAHADWLAPVGQLFRSLSWIAGALAVLLLVASGAVAVLTVRGALAAQRGTIDILHLVGATDVQIARLFQRQVARDMAVGVALGALAALVVAVLIGWQLQGISAGLLAGSGASWLSSLWLLLVAPLFVALTVLTTRWTVLRALKAMP